MGWDGCYIVFVVINIQWVCVYTWKVLFTFFTPMYMFVHVGQKISGLHDMMMWLTFFHNLVMVWDLNRELFIWTVTIWHSQMNLCSSFFMSVAVVVYIILKMHCCWLPNPRCHSPLYVCLHKWWGVVSLCVFFCSLVSH